MVVAAGSDVWIGMTVVVVGVDWLVGTMVSMGMVDSVSMGGEEVVVVVVVMAVVVVVGMVVEEGAAMVVVDVDVADDELELPEFEVLNWIGVLASNRYLKVYPCV